MPPRRSFRAGASFALVRGQGRGGAGSNAADRVAAAIHADCDCLERIWFEVRIAKAARKRFRHIHSIAAHLVFPDWPIPMKILIDSKPPHDIAALIPP